MPCRKAHEINVAVRRISLDFATTSIQTDAMTVDEVRERLRAIRVAKEWTVEQLTADIGFDRMSTSTVRRFLEQEMTPNKTTLFVLRSYLQGKKAA